MSKLKPPVYSKYTVIRDTREQAGKGWQFPLSERCAGTLVKKLDEGDYSILGLEKLFIIERKGSVSEFCGNLTQDRFMAPFDTSKPMDKQSEMVRLETIQWPFILLEFEVDDLIKYPNIPELPPRSRNTIKFKGSAALKKVIELEMYYRTRIIFCGNRGKDVASSIFKRIIEEIEKNHVKPVLAE